MKWYLEALHNYSDFKGRSSRKAYWMFFLVSMLISIGLGVILGITGAVLGLGSALSDAGAVIYALGILVPSTAVAVRRMHDMGRSGWWLLVPFVGFVFLIIASQPGDNEYGPYPEPV